MLRVSPDPAASVENARQPQRALLVDSISRTILGWIFEGHYGEGVRLPSERALAEQLGASRVAVREALRRLREWRVLSTRRGSGVVVRPRRDWGVNVLWSVLAHARDTGRYEEAVSLIRDALEIRRDLVQTILERAAPRLKGRHLEEERDIVSRAWTARKDVAAFLKADRRLIPAISEHAGMYVSVWLINSLAETYINSLLLIKEALQVPSTYRDKMLAMLGALERGDGPGAQRLMASYLEDINAAIVAALPPGIKQFFSDGWSSVP